MSICKNQPVPINNILPFENSFSKNNTNPLQDHVINLLKKGNIPLAENYIRKVLSNDSNNSYALNFLGWISSALNLYEMAISYFQKAAKNSNWEIPRKNIEIIENYLRIKCQSSQNQILQIDCKKYLLIKAWGYGFFSDVNHVLGQLLIADLTNRSPIIHWGEESLFYDKIKKNAFENFFENFCDYNIDDIQKDNLSYWPPKWNKNNLKSKEVNKWKGAYSRIAGQYLLNRQEDVVISDFYSSVADIKPWIPTTHVFHKFSINQIYFFLVNKYLKPNNLINNKVNNFLQNKLNDKDFIAVHVRGSDKALEVKNLKNFHMRYETLINQNISSNFDQKIFLMTDDARILDKYIKLYGKRVIYSESQRTNDDTGVHYKKSSNPLKLGIEVMTDVYIASKAKFFIGNGSSNASQIVRYLKKWKEENLFFIGPEINQSTNTFIHNW